MALADVTAATKSSGSVAAAVEGLVATCIVLKTLIGLVVALI